MPYPFGGYMGQILRVDLTRQKSAVEQLPSRLVRDYIGGTGFAARILFDELKSGMDALDPENRLIFATGPLVGTLWPTSGRWAVYAKSPLTDIWGESHCGGFFGAELKFAGYDMIIVNGRANKPVYLWIDDGRIEILSAKNLWNRNTAETTDAIREQHGDREIEVACIGPAGENLVRFACIMNNYQDAAGRAGLGAVMGSKRLKAVAVRGSQSVRVADDDKFMELVEDAHERVLKQPQAREMTKYGTPLLVAYKSEIGELPTRNHQTGIFAGAGKLKADTIRAQYFAKTRSCFGCRIMCKKVNRIPEGPYKGTISGGPEYESIFSLGTNCGIDDFGAIHKANQLCNLYGLDAISAGCVVAWLMECYERGLINRGQCDGLDPTWGNHGAMVTLIEKIAKREGIGDTLAEGSYRAAKKLGKGAEYVMHVKKLEISGQDGRTHRSVALTHAISVRGADHLRSLVTVDQLGYEETAAKRYGKDKLPEICDPYVEKYKAAAVKDTEDAFAIRDSLIVCWYSCGWPPIFWMPDFAAVAAAATGIKEFGRLEELYRIAQRICNLRRAFNVREGLDRRHDALPKRFTHEPMPEGPGKGQVANLEIMLREYYKLRGWGENGIPTRRTLGELGLSDVAAELERLGRL
ncbi:MAG: aldehyde ferredoxin oxidoreductase family protein [Candidatus Hodarchaeaceae archaeon]|nr:aldehyde ferredoxin oxidoreductase family protein [Candidatus Hodarchaeaceae archaeon]